jgi:hypothetical protein
LGAINLWECALAPFQSTVFEHDCRSSMLVRPMGLEK